MSVYLQIGYKFLEINSKPANRRYFNDRKSLFSLAAFAVAFALAAFELLLGVDLEPHVVAAWHWAALVPGHVDGRDDLAFALLVVPHLLVQALGIAVEGVAPFALSILGLAFLIENGGFRGRNDHVTGQFLVKVCAFGVIVHFIRKQLSIALLGVDSSQHGYGKCKFHIFNLINYKSI